MMFNTSTNGDPRSFFYYKGDYYINGTEIILKDEYINTHQSNGQKLWKYAKYERQTVHNGGVAYLFCASRIDRTSLGLMGLDEKIRYDYAPIFVVSALDIENLIEEFTRPIKLERAETEAIKEAIANPKSEFENPGVLLLWIVYIVAMIGSLIFNQFYILWIIITLLFLKWRKELLR